MICTREEILTALEGAIGELNGDFRQTVSVPALFLKDVYDVLSAAAEEEAQAAEKTEEA